MTDYVMVKRSDLLRWAEDFVRDNDPGDDTDVVTPFDDYLLRSPAEAQPRGRGCGDHDHASYIPGCGLCAATLPEKRMAASPSAPVGELPRYDPVLLSDFGGGNVKWWHDYIRAELDRAHDFYTGALAQQPAAADDLNAWRAAYVAERATRYREGGMKIEQARIHAETDAARIAALSAQQPAACAHNWHDYGTVNRAWCSRCNAVAVIGHEERPYGVLSVTDDGEYRVDPIQQPAAVDEAMVDAAFDQIKGRAWTRASLRDALTAALAAQQGDRNDR